MLGTFPVSGDLSMEILSATLTSKEQLSFAKLVALTSDPSSARNLATFVDETAQLGPVRILARGYPSQGTKILSTTAYISGTKTDIDVYRLPLS